MSLPAHLQSRGRSAYRSLLRSANLAFAGDARVRNAFHLKIRQDFIQGRAITNEEEYQTQIAHASEVAKVLRENVVQAVNEGEDNLWKIQWRKDIELGDNETIKQHIKAKNKARAKDRETDPASSVNSNTKDGVPDPHDEPSSSVQNGQSVKSKLSYKALLEEHRLREIPVLREDDLEETFVRGSGPGGQAINKTRSNVSLLHKPTGIRVTCQETRSLETNRKLARRILLERLDQINNPGLSKEQIKWAKERERKRRAKRKSNRKKRAAEEASEEAEAGRRRADAA